MVFGKKNKRHKIYQPLIWPRNTMLPSWEIESFLTSDSGKVLLARWILEITDIAALKTFPRAS